ncbi:MAG: oligosaccharide flippase family protein [Chloroflexus sp.]|uniref:oligosaccharide flippase family protein n=1 Tax=Chloroflexus sp. TaxID=1904827 RepID=UPI003D0B7883
MPEQTSSHPASRETLPKLYTHISPTLIPLIQGFITVAASAMFSRILSAITAILLIRYFASPVLYGQYATIVTQLTLISTFLGLGIDTWLLREGGRDPEQLSMNARRLIVLKFLGVVLLIIGLTIVWYQVSLSWLIVVGMLGVIAESYIRTCHVMLHALNRNSFVALLQSLSSVLAVGLILLLMSWSPQVSYVIVGQTLVSGVSLLVAVTALLSHWHGNWKPLHLIKLIQSASFFIISDIFATIYSQLHIFVLAIFTDNLSVGLFRSAVNLITITFLVPTAMFNVILPWLSRSKLGSKQKVLIIQGMTGISLGYGLVIICIFWWFSGNIVNLIYGNRYSEIIPLLLPMSVIPLFKSLSFVAVAVLLSLEAQKFRVFIQGFVIIFSMIGSLISIPQFGLDGAIWVYVAIEGLLSVLYGLGALVIWRKRVI